MNYFLNNTVLFWNRIGNLLRIIQIRKWSNSWPKLTNLKFLWVPNSRNCLSDRVQKVGKTEENRIWLIFMKQGICLLRGQRIQMIDKMGTFWCRRLVILVVDEINSDSPRILQLFATSHISFHFLDFVDFSFFLLRFNISILFNLENDLCNFTDFGGHLNQSL